MIYLISVISLFNVVYIGCFDFNFTIKLELKKITDLFSDEDLLDVYYKTQEETSYYAGSLDETDIQRPGGWYQPLQSKLVVKYVKVPVDHTHELYTGSWKMACVQNSEFWQPNAPIYLFVRGNKLMKYNELKEGIMYELANETGGVMFTAEHRYYGKKDPYKDFRYLTATQAIEDLNYLLAQIKAEPDYNNSKVVVLGGGYGGSLAVWLKKTHPDTVDIVVASGAPLLAKVDFIEHFMHTASLFQKLMPPGCAENIREQLLTYDFCFNKTDASKCLKTHFPFMKVCQSVNLTILENKQLFFFSEMSYYSDGTRHGMRQMFKTCRSVKKKTRVQEASMFWDEKKSCYNYDMQRFIRNIKKNPVNRKMKRWFYQCCNEFGLFPTTTAYPPPLSKYIPVEFYYKICSELFGPQFTISRIYRGIERTNKRYGGMQPNVDNVIFVFGELDTLQHAGVVESYSSSTEAIIIPESSHCKDLEPRNTTDTVALRKGRRRIKEFVIRRSR